MLYMVLWTSLIIAPTAYFMGRLGVVERIVGYIVNKAENDLKKMGH